MTAIENFKALDSQLPGDWQIERIQREWLTFEDAHGVRPESYFVAARLHGRGDPLGIVKGSGQTFEDAWGMVLEKIEAIRIGSGG